ncbi:MAG: hypothetical protein NWE89_06860 [Candidatus Bathyarchaeota archaeon]|nr:hypothetical protein [Candidatus Bathyarchaeota archaeon]
MESVIKQGHCAYCKTSIRPVIEAGPHSKTGAKYCPNCGAQIWVKHHCGANIRYEDRYCPKCGEANPIYLGNDPEYYADKTNNEE